MEFLVHGHWPAIEADFVCQNQLWRVLQEQQADAEEESDY